MNRVTLILTCVCVLSGASVDRLPAQESPDFLRQLQFEAVEANEADWIHWGENRAVFSSWTNHSNRLIPVYTFGVSLDSLQGKNSVYRDAEKLESIYHRVPESTVNPNAEYFDQVGIFQLQQELLANGSTKNIILIIFDGMDWQTSQAAAIYRNRKVIYTEGRGSGLSFLDYEVKNGVSDFGYMVTSADNNGTKTDVDAQVVTVKRSGKTGGYSPELGGKYPWSQSPSVIYLLGKKLDLPHIYTDSAASGSSMTSGIKTFNASINVDVDGNQVESMARRLQKQGYSVGTVTSVPISHATPACSYANNVSRNDYQDITRDLLGLRSSSHRAQPLVGLDVLIGCGWGEFREDDRKKQGENYVPGNKYITSSDMEDIDERSGGNYVVVERTTGQNGRQVLMDGAERALQQNKRLFGLFGTSGGHLPFQTADGNYNPTRGKSKAEKYSSEDLNENPTLADMASAALKVLSANDKRFWLMIEAGEVDWANHNNNIDDSIGAVFSGAAAFDVVTEWVENNSSWDETVVILTADHGHMMVVDDLEALTGNRPIVAEKPNENGKEKTQNSILNESSRGK